MASDGIVALGEGLLDWTEPVVVLRELLVHIGIDALFGLLHIGALASAVELFEGEILVALVTEMGELDGFLAHAPDLLELGRGLVGGIQVLEVAHALLLLVHELVLRLIHAPVHLGLSMRS